MGSWTYIGASATPLSELLFGDFDGNGITDVFRVANGTGEVSWGGPSGHSNWQPIGAFPGGIASIRLGNFDADDTTDFLRVSDDQWEIAYGTRAGPILGWFPFETLAQSGDEPESLIIGDFTGDGIDDIVRVLSRYDGWRFGN